MKNLKRIVQFLFVAILAVSLFSSCEDDEDPKVLPESSFTFSPATIVEWDVVTFTNTTTEGETYLWDFGDTNTSTDENPTHIFTEDGSYTVTLTATNTDGENVATETITVDAHSNVYTIDGTEYDITEAFEYVSGMTGAKHWRMTGEAFPGVAGDAPVNLLKFYPNLGTGSLEGTYTFDDAGDDAVGTFTYGMTENYAGMTWDFVDEGLTGATLAFTELETDLWKITIESGTLAQGDYIDWVWTANGTEFAYTVDYIGAITAAAK